MKNLPKRKPENNSLATMTGKELVQDVMLNTQNYNQRVFFELLLRSVFYVT